MRLGHDARETPRDAAHYRALMGAVCECDRPKQPKMSFCGICYRSLDRRSQMALYRKIGKGYGEAYDAAVRILKGEVKE